MNGAQAELLPNKRAIGHRNAPPHHDLQVVGRLEDPGRLQIFWPSFISIARTNLN